MNNRSNKILINAKFYIALAEDLAVNVKKANIVECLKNGAEVNVTFGNDENNTPLHIAVIRNDKEIVKLLLKHGARVNIPNDVGKTAIDLARDQQDRVSIAKLLEAWDKGINADTSTPEVDQTLKSTEFINYKKRAGTANVRGQLYETKLLTIVYLRALRCQRITKFYLGTNVDEIGDMDDLCMRIKSINTDSVVFLQAKHKQDVLRGKLGIQDLWRTSGDFSLIKYFKSYKKIQEKFNKSSDDVFFCGNYEDIVPYYIIYTTLKDDIEGSRKKLCADNDIVNLLGTTNPEGIFQINYDEQDIGSLTNVLMVENIKNLGIKLFKFIQDNKCDTMLCDPDIRRYHVVLAQNVINVTEINSEGYRKGSFRPEFFSSNEKLLIDLRDTLYAEAIKNNKVTEDEIDVSLLRISFLPQAESISELIGNVLVYDNSTNTLKLTPDAAKSKINFAHLLEGLEIPQHVVSEAFEIAGWNKLKTITFNLPTAFGNIDMTVNKKKVLKRLQYLSDKIFDVIKETSDIEGNVVIREGQYAPDRYLEAGVLAINGGIASAIGNVLVADHKNTLRFNLDVDKLGENAKQFHFNLKDRLGDLQKYRFTIEIANFPTVSLQASEYEKRLAEGFLNHLYFYTSQAKEEQFEEIVTKEIQAHGTQYKLESYVGLTKSESRIKSNALFLKIHNEMQNWWMLEQKAYYLTRDMHTFENIFRELGKSELLTYLNFIYLDGLNNTLIEFKIEAIDVLSAGCNDKNKMKVILTDVVALTCHKMVQYFKGTNDYQFIDIDYVCKVSPNCLEIITAELRMTDVSNVVIICKDLSKYNITKILRACNSKQIILITNKYIATEECLILRDDRIDLTDLTDESQNRVLQTHLDFQGIKVTLAEIYQGPAKSLINSKILYKIFNNDSIMLGQTLELSTYKEIKHYYVPRTLKLNDDYDDNDAYHEADNSSVESINYLSSSSFEENFKESPQKFSPRTLIDHHSVFKRKKKKRSHDIILILDAPGMGKSTLLTHLSLETKRRYPDIWIQRINLIDYTKQFYEWHESKVKVDGIEALKFVCEIALTKETFRNNTGITDPNIELEIVNDEIKLANEAKEDPLASLALNTFLYCFKTARIIFLFDGFDEICPHYKTEVIQLLKYLTRHCSIPDSTAVEETRLVQCVWITSRPYNDLRLTLEKEFGESYTLQPFYFSEIQLFLDKYMRRNLNLNELSSQQLMNISGFFEYMKRFDFCYDGIVKDVRLVNIPLHSIYVAAMGYFKNEIKRSQVSQDNLEFVQDWNIIANTLTVWRKYLNNFEGLKRTITLSGVPLHIYIAINYFQSQIKDTTITDVKELIRLWDLDTNAFAFYERFLQMKLKTIRFEEKNQMDLYNPDVKLTYEKEKKEFLDKHKKLAFSSVCSKSFLSHEELQEVEDIIKKMEIAEDKTGLVDRIVHGEPRFVHYTFAEYFAVEYITDLLKSDDSAKENRILNYVLNELVYWGTDGVLNLFDLKFKFDPALVAAVNKPHLRCYIFETLLEQNIDYPHVHDSYEPINMMYTALDMVVRYGLRYLSEFLIDCVISVVDETNFDQFLEFLKGSTFFKKLLDMWHDELVGKLLDCIRRIDASKIAYVYPLLVMGVPENMTNEEFIESYHNMVLLEKQMRYRLNRHLSH